MPARSFALALMFLLCAAPTGWAGELAGTTIVLQLPFRCKFTATPSRPTYLQRLALRRLIDAFSGAEIRFAAPNLMVQLTSAAAG